MSDAGSGGHDRAVTAATSFVVRRDGVP